MAHTIRIEIYSVDSTMELNYYYKISIKSKERINKQRERREMYHRRSPVLHSKWCGLSNGRLSQKEMFLRVLPLYIAQLIGFLYFWFKFKLHIYPYFILSLDLLTYYLHVYFHVACQQGNNNNSSFFLKYISKK